MEPVQLGSLRLQPFGLIFIALLIPFFVLCALQMKKNGLKKKQPAGLRCWLFRFVFCFHGLDSAS